MVGIEEVFGKWQVSVLGCVLNCAYRIPLVGMLGVRFRGNSHGVGLVPWNDSLNSCLVLLSIGSSPTVCLSVTFMSLRKGKRVDIRPLRLKCLHLISVETRCPFFQKKKHRCLHKTIMSQIGSNDSYDECLL